MNIENINQFLLKEYEKTFDVVNSAQDSMKNTIQFYLIFSSAIIGALPAIYSFLLHNKLSDISFNQAMVISSLLGIIAGIFACISLYKLRLRQTWCFSRMNMIRNIYLMPSINESPHIKSYCDSKFGSTKELILTKKQLLFHDWFLFMSIITAIIGIWVGISLHFVFDTNLYLLTIIFMFLFPLTTIVLFLLIKE